MYILKYLELLGIVVRSSATRRLQLMGQTNPPFMSGVPELLLLRLLGQREMYGYELVRSIKLVTSDAITLGEGVIYPVLHALERHGSLKAKRKKVDGRTRVYYSLTARGKKRLENLQGEWQRIQSGITAALEVPGNA
jgi:PadR family transcriptional regulator PadR